MLFFFRRNVADVVASFDRMVEKLEIIEVEQAIAAEEFRQRARDLAAAAVEADHESKRATKIKDRILAIVK